MNRFFDATLLTNLCNKTKMLKYRISIVVSFSSVQNQHFQLENRNLLKYEVQQKKFGMNVKGPSRHLHIFTIQIFQLSSIFLLNWTFFINLELKTLPKLNWNFRLNFFPLLSSKFVETCNNIIKARTYQHVWIHEQFWKQK